MEYETSQGHPKKVQQTRVGTTWQSGHELRSLIYRPMEITSKKPVTRLRQVVEVKKVVSTFLALLELH